MADHNKQTVCSIEEMAFEIYGISLLLGEYASESVCNIIHCTVSISCSSSLLFVDILVLCNCKV